MRAAHSDEQRFIVCSIIVLTVQRRVEESAVNTCEQFGTRHSIFDNSDLILHLTCLEVHTLGSIVLHVEVADFDYNVLAGTREVIINKSSKLPAINTICWVDL